MVNAVSGQPDVRTASQRGNAGIKFQTGFRFPYRFRADITGIVVNTVKQNPIPDFFRSACQQQVITVEHDRRIDVHSIQNLQLGFENTLLRAKIHHMGMSDIRDDGNRRNSRHGKIMNLTEMIHAHLHHRGFHRVIEPEQRFRQTDLIIQIALCFHCRIFR